MRTRTTSCCALALSCVLLLAGCSGGSDAAAAIQSLRGTSTSVEEARTVALESVTPQVASPAILEDGVLTVGLKSDSTLPLSTTGPQGSRLGLDVDLAAAIADELGLQVRYVDVSDPAAELGTTCDVVMGVSSGEAEGVVAVGRYAESCSALFARGKQAGTGLTAADLAGKVVAVQAGSASQDDLAGHSLDVSQSLCANLNDCFDALEAGEADYVYCSAYPGAYLAAQHDGVHLAGTLGEPSALGVGVSSANTTLQASVQQALATLGTNGRYDLVRQRWVGGMRNISSDDEVAGVQEADAAAQADATATEPASA